MLSIAALGVVTLSGCTSTPESGASTDAVPSGLVDSTGITFPGSEASGITATASPSSEAPTSTQRAAVESISTGAPTEEMGAAAPDAVPTEPVPAPGGGDINEEVAVEEQEVLPEVAVADPVKVGRGFEVEVLRVAATEATARAPGEIAGPAVLVEVRLMNNTTNTIDLGVVTVAAEDEQALPLSTLGTDPSDPFFGDLEAGDSATALYLFSFPEGSSTPIKISVNPAPEAPVAVFVGDPS